MAHPRRFTYRVRHAGLDYVFTADGYTEEEAGVDIRSQVKAKGFMLAACEAELIRVGRAS